MKKVLLFICLLNISVFSFGQITFQKTLGGAGNDVGYSIQQTLDSGYVITGYTTSIGAGGKDAYLVKTDAGGNVIWTKTYGGVNDDWAQSVVQTSDTGFILAGSTLSFGNGNSDFYIIKTNAIGDTVWSRTIGGIDADSAYSIQEILGYGYVVFGGINFSGTSGIDMLEANINYSGMVNQACHIGTIFNSANYDVARCGIAIDFNRYYILGYTNRLGSDDVEIGYVNNNIWTDDYLLAYDGTGRDKGYSLKRSSVGFIIAGLTTSFGAGNEDIYLLKPGAPGWSKAYGGAGSEVGYSVQQTFDGGFIVAGSTTSFGAGNSDIILLKTDINGNVLWAKTFGGSGNDYGYAVTQTLDSGLAVVGTTESFGAGSSDIFFIKTDSLGNSNCNSITVTCNSVSSIPSYTYVGLSTGNGGGPAYIATTTITQSTFQENDSICSVGIYEPSSIKNTFTISPNPSTQTITVTTTTNYKNLKAELYNIFGEKLFEKDFKNISSSFQIDVSQYKQGIYFLQLSDACPTGLGDATHFSKLVVEH